MVEVETGESVNHLEALAQWAHFGRLRAAFHLYVPAGMVDVARRLCEDNQIHVGEIWSYHIVGDQVRFTLVHRSKEAPPVVRTKPLVKAPATGGAASSGRAEETEACAKTGARGKTGAAAKPCASGKTGCQARKAGAHRQENREKEAVADS